LRGLTRPDEEDVAGNIHIIDMDEDREEIQIDN